MHTEPAATETADVSAAMEESGVLPRALWPRVDHLVTEDDTPVDNLFSAKQQRLLVDALYSSWVTMTARSFLADANVGVFSIAEQPAIVPDVFVSMDVQPHEGWWDAFERSYFVWDYGKPPDVVIEIVSNPRGHEADDKLRRYAWMHVPYYVIFDPNRQVGDEVVRIYRLHGATYERWESGWLPEIGLGLRLWTGRFEEREATWLRWCDEDGTLIPTGAERAQQERERAQQAEERAEQERERAEQERKRAEQERERAERLAARLRALGIDPDTIER